MRTVRFLLRASAATGALAAFAPAQTTLESVNAAGEPANGNCFLARVTENGRYIAFASEATNLVANDTNNRMDVFVRDTVTGVVEIVSLDTQDEQFADDSGFDISISSTGRYVAFYNYRPAESRFYIYRRDRLSATTLEIEWHYNFYPYVAAWHSGIGNGWMSRDGRYIAYFDAFPYSRRYDCVTGQLEIISASTIVAAVGYSAVISGDGNYGVFMSTADNIVPGDQDGAGDYFVRSFVGGPTQLITVEPGSVDGIVIGLDITPDGRYVVFDQLDGSNIRRVYLRDLVAGGNAELITVSSSGTVADGDSFHPQVSDNGRYVVFDSQASNLIDGTSVNPRCVYRRDRQLGITELASRTNAGAAPNGNSRAGHIYPYGNALVFTSNATDLDPQAPPLPQGVAQVYRSAIGSNCSSCAEVWKKFGSGLVLTDPITQVTWPSQPPIPKISYLSSAPPLSGVDVLAVEIQDLTHTFVGDLQFVLVDPLGRAYNLFHRPGFTGSGYGSSGDFTGGTYTFVAQLTPGASTAPSSGDIAPNVYRQEFGSGAGQWPSGTNGVVNAQIDSVSPRSGAWALYVYDWASGDTGSFTRWSLHGLTGHPFSVDGAGGAIPASGTGGGGVWPTGTPPSPVVSATANVPPSPVVSSVELLGLTHSWIGDLQIALFSPSGVATNLLSRPGFTGSGVGSNGDALGGTYTFVEPGTSGAASVPLSGDWSPGIFAQHFGDGGGTWPDGEAGINNVFLRDLPASGGPWTLKILDWESGDVGSFSGWRINGYFAPPEPRAYCTGGTTSHGCAALISASDNPSASFATRCVVRVDHVEGQKTGIVFYGIAGPSAYPWAFGGTSYLCVQPPTQRTTTQSSGGTLDACDGEFALDWDAFRQNNPSALGQPFTAGESVWLQAWFRDPPAPATTNLSNGLELVHVP